MGPADVAPRAGRSTCALISQWLLEASARSILVPSPRDLDAHPVISDGIVLQAQAVLEAKAFRTIAVIRLVWAIFALTVPCKNESLEYTV